MANLIKLPQAIAALNSGKRVRHVDWSKTKGMPTYVIFIPGRIIEVSFAPLVDILPKGTRMLSRGHIDAIFVNEETASVPFEIAVGWGEWMFTAAELVTDISKLVAEWEVVE